MEEQYQASENMKKFFEKLLDLKSFVREKVKETKDANLKQVLDKLEDIIKEGE